jgi:hypothetical protein
VSTNEVSAPTDPAQAFDGCWGQYAQRQLMLDLDAIKRAGLNSAQSSQRLLRAHQQREHADLTAALRQSNT